MTAGNVQCRPTKANAGLGSGHWPATTITGPNDASGIVWALDMFFFLFFFVFSLTS